MDYGDAIIAIDYGDRMKAWSTSNPQVISNSNLLGSKVLVHVNHDSWNARIVWFGTPSPLTPQCDLMGHQVARNVLHAVTATKVDTCQQTCNLALLVAEWRTSETQYFVDNRTYIMGKCSLTWNIPPKGVILSGFICTFAMSCYDLCLFWIATLR